MALMDPNIVVSGTTHDSFKMFPKMFDKEKISDTRFRYHSPFGLLSKIYYERSQKTEHVIAVLFFYTNKPKRVHAKIIGLFEEKE